MTEPLFLNAFGRRIPSRREIFQDPACVAYIRETLAAYLAALGAREPHFDAVEAIVTLGVRESDDDTYEREAHRLLQAITVAERWLAALEERASRIESQVRPWLMTGSVLDYGGGDGRLAVHLQRSGFAVTCADVFRAPLLDATLPFVLLDMPLRQQQRSLSFTNAILCTVLHHSESPLEVMHDVRAAVSAGGRLLVIESVCDLGEDDERAAPRNSPTDRFLSLPSIQRLMVNVFFDHFYNRCVFYSDHPQTKVNVPYNYLSTAEWPAFLAQEGFQVIRTIHLGVDQRLAPLYHVLYVLDGIS